jgi:hypothetical protein
VPGAKDIVAITRATQLHAEGVEQCNCAGFYVWRVLPGGAYICRSMAPVRATLAIVRGPTAVGTGMNSRPIESMGKHSCLHLSVSEE